MMDYFKNPLHIPAIQECAMVDRLAELLAQIAPLTEEAEEIKTALKMLGRERIHGTAHDAVIILSEREALDMKALKAENPELVARYRLPSTLVTSCKLTARKKL